MDDERTHFIVTSVKYTFDVSRPEAYVGRVSVKYNVTSCYMLFQIDGDALRPRFFFFSFLHQPPT